MKSYLIQGVDDSLWAKVKARAALEQKPLYEAVLDALRTYATWEPPRVSPKRTQHAAQQISERIRSRANGK